MRAGAAGGEVPGAAGGVAVGCPRPAADSAIPGTESSLPSSMAGIMYLSHILTFNDPTDAVFNPFDFLMDFHHFFLCSHTDVVQQLHAFSYKLFLSHIRLELHGTFLKHSMHSQ